MTDNTSEGKRSYVSFAIYGADLDPDEVSRLLGIRPDSSHRKGDVKRSSRSDKTITFDTGHWSITSRLSAFEPFEAHLESLFDRLEGKEAEIRSLTKTYEIKFYCDIWKTIGVELPAHIIQRIAALNISIGITIYG